MSRKYSTPIPVRVVDAFGVPSTTGLPVIVVQEDGSPAEITELTVFGTSVVEAANAAEGRTLLELDTMAQEAAADYVLKVGDTITGQLTIVNNTEGLRFAGANPYLLAKNAAQTVDLGFFQFTTTFNTQLWQPAGGSFKVTIDAVDHVFNEIGLNITGEARCDSLRIDQAPAAGAIVPTHSVIVNINGTDYKFPCVAA